MSAAPTNAHDAGYLYLTQLLAHRARELPRELVSERVEQAFRDLCIELAPTVSLEVGAHEAAFSRWLKSELPNAHCVAFEANPYVHDKFADGLDGTGVDYHHLAVSEINGTVDLGIPRRFHNPLLGKRSASGARVGWRAWRATATPRGPRPCRCRRCPSTTS